MTGSGLLTRCGPLSLLLASFILAVGGLTLGELRPGLVGLAAQALVVPLLLGRTRVPLLRLVPGLLAIASVTWSNWLLADPRSLEAASVAGLRIALFVLLGLVLASFLDPATLGDHLGQRLRLPPRPVLAGVVALGLLESLADDWESLDRSRRARGLGPGRGPLARVRHVGSLLLGLLVSALRQASRLTVAMEARGYSAQVSGGPARTWAQPAPWRRADTLLVLVAAALAATPALSAPLF